MAFKLKSSASKEALKKQQERGGSGMKAFKMDSKKIARLLILPPVDEKEAIFAVNQEHKHFDNATKRPIVMCASPFAFNEKDDLAMIGFAMKKKFEKLDDKDKKKDLWRHFLPKKEYYVNVLDLDDLDAGVYQFCLPGSAVEVLMDELEDVGDDLTTICDFDEGRPLIVKSNMKKGLQRRYKIKFAAEGAELDLSDEEKEAIEKSIYQLSKVQKKFKQEDYDKLRDFLTKKAKALGVNINDMLKSNDDDEDAVEEDDEGEESEIEDYDDKKSKKSKSSGKKNKDDDEDEDEETEIEDFDDEEDTKKSKKSTKTKTKKVEEDDDLESEEEEEEEKTKKSSKVKAKTKSKPKEEDEDEFESEVDDDNDFDDDEDEDEKPKTKSKTKTKARR